MKTIHVLSTAGWRMATGQAQYEMDAPELMTMILSALEWRKYGEIELYTDNTGVDFMLKHRLEKVYNRFVRLPAMERINHQIFWDVYKTVALAMTCGEAVISDIDLVVFKKPFGLGRPGAMVFGHPEPIEMQPYPLNREHFEKLGFSYDWNWSAPAINTCLIWMPLPNVRSTYTHFSLGFAESYSQYFAASCGAQNPGWQFEPAMFASQRLLGMVMDWLWVANGEKRFLFELGELPHHRFTPRAFHLWGRKEIYRTCIEPRIQFLNWLRAKIMEQWPNVGKEILEANRLYHTFTMLTERMALQNNGRVVVDYDDHDTLFTRSVILSPSSEWYAMDPCSGLIRTLRRDTAEKIYRGDVLFTRKPGQCTVWWNKQQLAELAGPCAPGKADWIWNVPVNTRTMSEPVKENA
jgi:hypothetical protein